MNRNLYKWAIVLMWLALPAAGWGYWRMWDQLPAQMALHFDAHRQPNGFASREGALQTGLGIMIAMLVLFTSATIVLARLKPVAVWPALVISYVIVGFCWYGNHSIVKFNLKAQPAHSELVGPNSPALRDSVVLAVPQPRS
jgi:hypothetical protein